MCELIVVGFKEGNRAAQTLLQLQYQKERLFDLDEAISLSWIDKDNLVVQLSINLTAGGGEGWVRFWGSFIRSILYFPFTQKLRSAARAFNNNIRSSADEQTDREDQESDQLWWKEDLCVSVDFIRDVGAVVHPGSSAILSVSKDFDADAATARLLSYGGSLLHTRLCNEQIKKIKLMLLGEIDQELSGRKITNNVGLFT